jgi:hypothetical protein
VRLGSDGERGFGARLRGPLESSITPGVGDVLCKIGCAVHGDTPLNGECVCTLYVSMTEAWELGDCDESGVRAG